MTDALDRARIDAGLTHRDLWVRYLGLGGSYSALVLEAVLYGASVPTTHEHDLIAHAINERCVELGGNHPVPYDGDSPGASP